MFDQLENVGVPIGPVENSRRGKQEVDTGNTYKYDVHTEEQTACSRKSTSNLPVLHARTTHLTYSRGCAHCGKTVYDAEEIKFRNRNHTTDFRAHYLHISYTFHDNVSYTYVLVCQSQVLIIAW